VLIEVLGLSTADVARLAQSGAVGLAPSC
jgi:hypothetical protein